MLKIVELSCGAVEDVNYYGGVVKSQPVSGIVALGVKRIAANLGKAVGDLVAERIYVSRGTTLANYEVVGEGGLLFYLKQLYSS